MLSACPSPKIAYNARVTHSGWRLNGGWRVIALVRPAIGGPEWSRARRSPGVFALMGSCWPSEDQQRLCAGEETPWQISAWATHRKKGRHMPLYEHVFLARQDISNAQVEALTKEFSDVIAEGGGSITKSEYWGVKNLAYKIKKNRKAHFSLLNIDAPAAAVAEMERRMGIQPDILRFMTVKVEAHETEPSVMMRKQDREERGERGDRGDRGPRGGGFRGDREGGSTFRSRPPREGGGFREGGERGPRPDGDRPRGPRPPRNDNPSGSEG